MGEKILTLHDKALPHSAAATVEGIGQLRYELLSHSKCTRPSSPSDYHVSRPLKEFLRGRR